MNAHHQTSRGDHTLNVRMLWFRGRVEREEPAMLALDLLSQDRADDALDVAITALEKTPRDAELLLCCARAHLMRGSIAFARDAAIAAAREGKDWAEAFAWLARILVREGRGAKAAEVAERAVLLGASDPDLASIEGPRRGARLLRERTRRYLSSPERDEPTLLAMALEKAGEKAKALEVIEKGLEGDPGDPDLISVRCRLTGELEEIAATTFGMPAIEIELTDEEREEAFFASLGIKSAPVMKDEPSVIVSDTLVGEPAPKVHARSEIAIPMVASATVPFPLTRVAPTAGKRSGWLPRIGERHAEKAAAKADERLPGMPPATVRVAPIANVARRDPTVRFWIGLR